MPESARSRKGLEKNYCVEGDVLVVSNRSGSQRKVTIKDIRKERMPVQLEILGDEEE